MLAVIMSFILVTPELKVSAESDEASKMTVTNNVSGTEKIDMSYMNVVELDAANWTEEANSEIVLESIENTDKVREDLPSNLAELPAHASIIRENVDADFEIGSVTDYIVEEKTFKGVYPFYTYPGELLQAQLQSPNSLDLDYDLYLFKFNMNTGNLVNTPIDISAYNTTSLPMIPEGVGDVNTLNVNQAYAIMAYSKRGCSADIPFTLSISVTKASAYNAEEANDSSYKATGLSQDIGAESNFTVSEVNLNAPIDKDWYTVNVPSTLDFEEIDIQVTGDVEVETYKAVSGATLEKYGRSQSAGYYIGSGTVYIRVLPKAGVDFGNHKKEYSLNISVQQYKFSQVGNEFRSNGEPWKRQNYSHGGNRYAFIDSSVLEWKMYYMSPSGYLCKNIQDSAYMKIVDEAWDNPIMREAKSEPSITKDGVTKTLLRIMPGRGQWTDLTLYYDYDVYLTMYSSKVGTVADRQPVFRCKTPLYTTKERLARTYRGQYGGVQAV